jgi:TonB-dependent starch-binding outer membrane protein SusC
MKKILQCIIFLMLTVSSVTTLAQDRTVSGKVTAADDGSTLPGVNVVLKGTTIGASTDTNGRYTLSIPAAGGTLVFSFIGLASQEIEVGQRATIDVTMQLDSKQLSEVVVIGYGTQDKRTLTSAISTVKGADIAAMPVQSFDQALIGKASGVQVTVGTGMVGQAPRVRIRGSNSISSGQSPLYVIDGVPSVSGNQSLVASGNPLGDINPNDIESVDVLKDGAATAIYGSRAANGVILITTKKGKSGKPAVNFDYQVGVNTIAKRFNLLNADEFIAISNEKFATTNTAPQAFPGPDNVNTNWQDVIFKTGLTQNYNFNISGGSKDVSYYLSAGYMDQQGAVKRNELQRYSMLAKVDYNGVDWLSAGMKLQVTRQVNNNLNTGAGGLSGNVASALKAFPNVPVFDAANPTGYNLTSDGRALGRGNNLLDIASSYTNAQYTTDKNIFRADNYRVLANGYLQANITEGLNIRTQLGTDILINDDFQSWDPFHGDGGGSTFGYVYRGSYKIFTWNWQNTLNYKKTFGENHNLAITVGNEYQKRTEDYFFGDGQTFTDPLFVRNGLITGSYLTQTSGGDYDLNGFDSYFGRLNYDYAGKYLIGLSVRNDAISSIPLANRKGTFFGGSAGWVVSNESFFSVSSISQLKIRGSYAEVGNTAIDNFTYVGSYAPALYGGQSGILFDQVGNPLLKWETSKKLDIGVDLGFLNNRITASIEYYKNSIDGLILDAPTSPTAGIPGNSISKNVGAMENSGFEITIASDNMTKGDFNWSSDVTFTTNKNKVTALVAGQDIVNLPSIIRVGEPLGSVYAFEYAGVNSFNGNPLYVRGDGSVVQGNPDDQRYYLYDPANPAAKDATTALGDADLKVVGQYNPKWFGGLNNTVRWKSFDVGVLLTYAGGNKIFNATRQGGFQQEFTNNFKDILNRWTPENPNTDVPRLKYAASTFLNVNSTRFVENADYIRLQNVSVGYTFPKRILSTFAKGSISSLRLTAQVRNAFVFTKYKGTDPETAGAPLAQNNGGVGIDNNTNPLLRTFNFGLNIGL